MDIVASGIRPTGFLHLGNYFGALRNFIKMQNENKCFFFIADYHSLTTHPHPSDLQTNVRNVLIDYIAAGLDPEKATIYVQSDVPQVCELSLLLSMNVYVGELQRVASFLQGLLLLRSLSSRLAGFSRCGCWALEDGLRGCGRGLRCSVACGSFLDQACAPCMGRQVLNCWITRELPGLSV